MWGELGEHNSVGGVEAEEKQNHTVAERGDFRWGWGQWGGGVIQWKRGFVAGWRVSVNNRWEFGEREESQVQKED